jgi:hypothetical protein
VVGLAVVVVLPALVAFSAGRWVVLCGVVRLASTAVSRGWRCRRGRSRRGRASGAGGVQCGALVVLCGVVRLASTAVSRGWRCRPGRSRRRRSGRVPAQLRVLWPGRHPDITPSVPVSVGRVVFGVCCGPRGAVRARRGDQRRLRVAYRHERAVGRASAGLGRRRFDPRPSGPEARRLRRSCATDGAFVLYGNTKAPLVACRGSEARRFGPKGGSWAVGDAAGDPGRRRPRRTGVCLGDVP